MKRGMKKEKQLKTQKWQRSILQITSRTYIRPEKGEKSHEEWTEHINKKVDEIEEKARHPEKPTATRPR